MRITIENITSNFDIQFTAKLDIDLEVKKKCNENVLQLNKIVLIGDE